VKCRQSWKRYNAEFGVGPSDEEVQVYEAADLLSCITLDQSKRDGAVKFGQSNTMAGILEDLHGLHDGP